MDRKPAQQRGRSVHAAAADRPKLIPASSTVRIMKIVASRHCKVRSGWRQIGDRLSQVEFADGGGAVLEVLPKQA